MSSPIRGVEAKSSVKDARKFLRDNTYTATCLVVNGVPIDFYVTHEGLANIEQEYELGPAATLIEDRFRIDVNNSVFDTLDRLAENMKAKEIEKFLFCFENGKLIGILTSSDLNKPEVDAYIMAELIELESVLNKLIIQEMPSWEDDLPRVASKERIQKFRKLYKMAGEDKDRT